MNWIWKHATVKSKTNIIKWQNTTNRENPWINTYGDQNEIFFLEHFSTSWSTYTIFTVDCGFSQHPETSLDNTTNWYNLGTKAAKENIRHHWKIIRTRIVTRRQARCDFEKLILWKTIKPINHQFLPRSIISEMTSKI